ncbi:MAG: hypothetical protein EBY16_03880, partial [Gammaproteobacteria bacterium]|nr:hypothetical protein [Gammaproteobacteria bacterium]
IRIQADKLSIDNMVWCCIEAKHGAGMPIFFLKKLLLSFLVFNKEIGIAQYLCRIIVNQMDGLSQLLKLKNTINMKYDIIFFYILYYIL